MLPTILSKPRLADDVALGARLAKMQERPIGPEDVADVLNTAKVKHVIVGAHATNGYTGRPRATVDVDVIARFPKKAAQAIARAFPHLKMQDTPVVIRFKDQDREAIDVMKPIGSTLWSRLLEHGLQVRVGSTGIRIPVLEGVLASKFAAMVSIHRRPGDKMIDGGDFIRMVEVNTVINLQLLSELGDLVYPGGGKEILKLVADARAGKRIEF